MRSYLQLQFRHPSRVWSFVVVARGTRLVGCGQNSHSHSAVRAVRGADVHRCFALAPAPADLGPPRAKPLRCGAQARTGVAVLTAAGRRRCMCGLRRSRRWWGGGTTSSRRRASRWGCRLQLQQPAMRACPLGRAALLGPRELCACRATVLGSQQVQARGTRELWARSRHRLWYRSPWQPCSLAG